MYFPYQIIWLLHEDSSYPQKRKNGCIPLTYVSIINRQSSGKAHATFNV